MPDTFKLGKLPARKDAILLKLAAYSVGLPTPPLEYGHQSLVTTWGMFGNDRYGDCVFAGAAHETMLWCAEAGKRITITDEEVLANYSAVTGFNPSDPNTDQGTDMQAAASFRRKTGILAAGTRHQIAAYLAVRLKSPLQLRTALYLFGAVGIGIQFPDSAMRQFNAGQPWSVVAGARIEGGHYIPAIGYDPKYIYIITWGKIQKMSWSFYNKYADEVVAYLSRDYLTGEKSLEGFDYEMLSRDINSLGNVRVPLTPKSSIPINTMPPPAPVVDPTSNVVTSYRPSK